MNRIFQLSLLAASLLAQAALAQTSPVTSTLVARRVELVDGKQVLVPADAVKPGDTVEYASTYRNTGKQPIEGLTASIPVPPYTSYLAGSAQPAKAQASTDGARFAAIPLTRAVRAADGSTRQEPVPPADYKAVRWEVGTLAPGAEVTLRLRVRVDAQAATPATQAPARP